MKDTTLILGCSGLIVGASWIFLSGSKMINDKASQLENHLNSVETLLQFSNQKIDSLIKMTNEGNCLLDELIKNEVSIMNPSEEVKKNVPKKTSKP